MGRRGTGDTRGLLRAGGTMKPREMPPLDDPTEVDPPRGRPMSAEVGRKCPNCGAPVIDMDERYWDAAPEGGVHQCSPNVVADLPYDAVSVNGRAMEWKGPLWDAINALPSASAMGPDRLRLVGEIERAVETAMRIA